MKGASGRHEGPAPAHWLYRGGMRGAASLVGAMCGTMKGASGRHEEHLRAPWGDGMGGGGAHVGGCPGALCACPHPTGGAPSGRRRR
eukprot:1142406-Prorocentrum_minimum.AAC.1